MGCSFSRPPRWILCGGNTSSTEPKVPPAPLPSGRTSSHPPERCRGAERGSPQPTGTSPAGSPSLQLVLGQPRGRTDGIDKPSASRFRSFLVWKRAERIHSVPQRSAAFPGLCCRAGATRGAEDTQGSRAAGRATARPGPVIGRA